jgi:hypothetical protein
MSKKDDDDDRPGAAAKLAAHVERADDDARRREILGKSPEELDRDLAAAGVDVARVNERAKKLHALVRAAAADKGNVVQAEERFRRPRVSTVAVAAAVAAAFVATLGGGVVIAYRDEIWPDRNVAKPAPAPDAAEDAGPDAR